MNHIKTDYDPDFDRGKNTIFKELNPKLAFWSGFVISILGAGTIGFFVMLGLHLN